MILRLVVRADLLPKGKSARRTSGTRISAPFGRWTIAAEPPRHAALCRITKREGIVARGIARPAARRARMIMAMRATCKRAAALAARGYEMPQGGMIRSPSKGLLYRSREREVKTFDFTGITLD